MKRKILTLKEISRHKYIYWYDEDDSEYVNIIGKERFYFKVEDEDCYYSRKVGSWATDTDEVGFTDYEIVSCINDGSLKYDFIDNDEELETFFFAEAL